MTETAYDEPDPEHDLKKAVRILGVLLDAPRQMDMIQGHLHLIENCDAIYVRCTNDDGPAIRIKLDINSEDVRKVLVRHLEKEVAEIEQTLDRSQTNAENIIRRYNDFN